MDPLASEEKVKISESSKSIMKLLNSVPYYNKSLNEKPKLSLKDLYKSKNKDFKI